MSKTIDSVKKKSRKTTSSSVSSKNRPPKSSQKPAKKSASKPTTTETPSINPASTLTENTMPQQSKSAKSHKLFSGKNRLNLIARICACIAIISFITLFVGIFRLDILPTKYLVVAIAATILLTAINLFLALFKKKATVLRIISIILSTVFSAAAIFAFLKINDTINFFAGFGSSEITNTYNIIVADHSELDENSDLSGQTIYTYRDLTIKSDLVSEAIKSNYNADTEFIDNILTLAADLVNDPTHIGAINAGAYEAFLSDNELYKGKLRVIRSFDIITEAEQSHKVDITKDPFVIYLSGIDTRYGDLPSRSRSDVNIVATINPKDHKILLTVIPRDYYVHLAGTPEDGLMDKLTHAGSQGGIALSKATIEELLDIDINYYIRVNFNFVQRLVDAIGGIDIDPGVNYSFTCWTDRGCRFHPGINSVDGRCALAYARERKSFHEGDINRGEHQEQVIGLILDKISNSSTLLSNYSGILAAVDGTFETNIESEDITSFFKNQLEDMKPWKVDNANLKGEGVLDLTYSYPDQNLYVMYPDESTIEAAKTKIHEYLGK